MTKILVTGGTGFIGTHLCRELRKQNFDVTALDIKPPKDIVDGVRFIQGDVRNADTVEKAMLDVDAVFHLAALVSVPLCQENPLESYQTNLASTCLILDKIKDFKLKKSKNIRFIFSGSSVVYGSKGRDSIALSEEEICNWPLSFYGAQKLASEQMIQLFVKAHQIPATVFRFFNVYGPGQDPNSPYSGVISIFSKNIKNQKPLTLNGGGLQTRDFISVYDVVRACSLALKLDEAKCDGSAINLGSGKAITIQGLAKTMIQNLKSKNIARTDSLIEVGPKRAGDIEHSMASIERARTILNWNPQISLEDGLAELL